MSSTTSKYEVLEQEISEMIKKTTRWSKENKRKSFYIYICISISSVLITFLVAIGNDIPEHLRFGAKILTLFFSGLTTVLAAWDGFYNHKQLWVNYGETRDYLKSIQLKLKLLDTDKRTDDNVLNDIYKEYQDLLHNSNSKWRELRMEEVNHTSKE
ncbi:SLATT domain-containing protein [Tenacibaculum sp. IB213877]|uniref:SLATT domain-containing protein n=1 Tax=Tenacibaculum sp. IB213877 TaxID=3097351 RepID=UPI002A5A40A9|nr:DUF4231 domain-containing protein [Tenacibaculum sp. IB213877]MDY0779384.1 DUF4231 domain-containing protein [Tenacibaculum sp. IB213877]